MQICYRFFIRGEFMIIRNMEVIDYKAIDKLMQQVYSLHVENRPDLYVALEHPLSINDFEESELIKNEVGIQADSIRNRIKEGGNFKPGEVKKIANYAIKKIKSYIQNHGFENTNKKIDIFQKIPIRTDKFQEGTHFPEKIIFL